METESRFAEPSTAVDQWRQRLALAGMSPQAVRHLEQAAAQSVLDGLRRDFAGADIHYWLTPVSEFGHLG
jgi:hypothetical protein